MTAITQSQPIGIFDSGIGGLTVASAIKSVLPNESLIYFGDIAHLPYGDKSVASIQAYSVKITDVLLQKGCKAIVIACNSASSAAYSLLKEYTASRAKVINVIDPMVNLVTRSFAGEPVGLIGTKRTVESNVYKQNIDSANCGIDLRSLPTPLLVPMIEEGFVDNRISHDIIDEYLGNESLKGIKALILGCTHYPLISKQITEYYQGVVRVIDSADVVAQSVKKYLEANDLLNAVAGQEDHFLVSDFTPSFEHSAKSFFHSDVRLEKYSLWE